MSIEFAATPTMVPSQAWVDMTDEERLKEINGTLLINDLHEMSALSAKQDGHVIVKLNYELTAHRRGTLLLNAEALLKYAIDSGITVWLAPLGDKNSLRNLRGIEMT